MERSGDEDTVGLPGLTGDDLARDTSRSNTRHGGDRVKCAVPQEKFDFSKYKTMCDTGGATGQLCAILAARHPHLECTSFDLPVVAPIAENAIATAGLDGRVKIASGDFLSDPLPRAYDALPEGGAFIVIENRIDDARRENAFGLMMSLNMLSEFGDAFDFTGSDFARLRKSASHPHKTTVPSEHIFASMPGPQEGPSPGFPHADPFSGGGF